MSRLQSQTIIVTSTKYNPHRSLVLPHRGRIGNIKSDGQQSLENIRLSIRYVLPGLWMLS